MTKLHFGQTRLRSPGLRLRSRAVRATGRAGSSPEIWVLLNLALQKYARKHAHWAGRLSADDISEIASRKAADLLRRLDSKSWDPAGLSSAQLCGLLSAIARNGVVDLRRVRRREVSTPEGFDVLFVGQGLGAIRASKKSPDSGWTVRPTRERSSIAPTDLPSVRGARGTSRDPLRDRVGRDRARSGRRDALRPAWTRCSARCREQMRSCLAGKGFVAGPFPPGTFARLWEMTSGEGVRP